MNVSDRPVKAAGKLHEEVQRLRAEVASLKEERDALNEENSEAYISLAIESVRSNSLREGIASLAQQLAAANGRVEMLREALETAYPYMEQSVEQLHEALKGYKPHVHEQADKDLAQVRAALFNLNEDSAG
jgi:DNA repair exonuclease SbcCD ATPase subunit